MAAVITLLAASAIPFGRVLLPANPGFMPSFGALVLLTDAMTAGLLIVQSTLRGHRRARQLGAAYLFSAMIVVPHLLAFPGVFAATPIIGGTDTAVWLWCIWHGGFSIGVLRFVLVHERPSRPGHLPRLVIGLALTVLTLCLIVTVGLPWLPTLLQGGDYHRLNTLGIGPVILGTTLAAGILVVSRLKLRDPVAIWLGVAMLAAALDVTLTLFGGGRFTMGWYGARVLSLVTSVTVLFSLLSELMREAGRVAEVNAQLEHLLCTDVLTELANRRAFEAALEAEWRRANREQTSLSLLMIDIDFFKGYNDRYGHPAGDDCLRIVAGALGSEMQRPADMAARIGGEEFGILLPMTDEAGAWQVAERVRLGVSRLAIPHEASELGYVTVSIGIATARPIAVNDDLCILVNTADRALYDAKASGRDAIRGGVACELAMVAA